MVIIKNITIVKPMEVPHDFYERIMAKNMFSSKKIKSIALIYAQKKDAEPLESESVVHEHHHYLESIKQSFSTHQQIIQASKMIQSTRKIHIMERLKDDKDVSSTINIPDLIHQISYETSRSYRLAENFRRLLFRHFEGYEHIYLGDVHHENHHLTNQNMMTAVTSNRIHRLNTLNERVVDRFHEHHETLRDIDYIFNVVERLPSKENIKNHVKHLHEIIYYEPLLNHHLLTRYEKKVVTMMNIQSILQHLNTIKPRSLLKVMQYLNRITLKDVHVDQVMNLSTMLHQIILSNKQSHASWLLKTLLTTQRKSSKYNREYQRLFASEKPTKLYKMITYNNIIQESYEASKNLRQVNDMILIHSKETEAAIKEDLIHQKLKKEKHVDLNDINPFHVSQRKNQNKIVTNLLGMIANEMSKNIAVRNMMNHLVVHTETVSDIKKTEMAYSRWFGHHKEKPVHRYEKEETTLQFKENKKIVKEETASQIDVFNHHEFIKKHELVIEPNMLTEQTISYLSQRLIEDIEVKRRRDYERRGRH